MRARRQYSLEEVRALGLQASFEDAVGVLYLWKGSYCLRFDRRTGVTVQLSGTCDLPAGPWHELAAVWRPRIPERRTPDAPCGHVARQRGRKA